MSTAPPGPTLADVLRGRRGRFLLALLLTEFAGAMQGIAYSTVLPVLARDLDGFTLFGATLALPVAAQWKWRGANGQMQYSDLPPPPGVVVFVS